ncbi:hypothetical protein Dsin_013919, partial [Dipteronia sinensis]
YNGMMTVSITPNHHASAIVASAFYALFTLLPAFSSRNFYGLIVTQYGDSEETIKVLGISLDPSIKWPICHVITEALRFDSHVMALNALQQASKCIAREDKFPVALAIPTTQPDISKPETQLPPSSRYSLFIRLVGDVLHETRTCGQLLGRNEDGLLPSSSSQSCRQLLAAVTPSCRTIRQLRRPHSPAVLSSTAATRQSCVFWVLVFH